MDEEKEVEGLWDGLWDDLDGFASVVNELRGYAELEGTELGETCRELITLAEYSSSLSSEFLISLKRELERYLDFFKEHCEIVTKTVTVTDEIKELEWYD